jgi:ankyrin repeat protein
METAVKIIDERWKILENENSDLIFPKFIDNIRKLLDCCKISYDISIQIIEEKIVCAINYCQINGKHTNARYKEYSALDIMTIYDYPIILELLLKNRVDIDKEEADTNSPFAISIMLKQIECIKIFLKYNANLYYDVVIYEIGKCYSIEIIELLINAGINVNFVDHHGYTILFHVIDIEDDYINDDDKNNIGYKIYKISKFLLENNADPNICNNNRHYLLKRCLCLDFIDKKYYVKLIKILLKYNANINEPTIKPLIIQLINDCKYGITKDVVEILLENGMETNIKYKGKNLIEIIDTKLHDSHDEEHENNLRIMIKLLFKRNQEYEIPKNLRKYHYLLSIKQEIKIKSIKKNYEKALFAQKYKLCQEIYAPNAIGYNVAKQSFNATSMRNIK